MFATAKTASPEEIVGLIAGPNTNRGTQLLPLLNISTTPNNEYVAEPKNLIRALASIRQMGLELVAIYHSHPNGPATPSRKDILQAQWDAPYIIIDAQNTNMRAWSLLQNTGETAKATQPKEIQIVEI